MARLGPVVLSLVLGFIACGGQSRGDRERAAAGAAAEGDAGASSVELQCSTDDECLAVLDTHLVNTNCYLPTAASREDVARDPCLIPWLPNPRCSLPEPAPSCVVSMPVPIHSCPAPPACATTHCVSGTCTLDVNRECDPGDPPNIDCEALRTEYVQLLELGRACDPTEDPPSCQGHLADTCGCALPYDHQGPYAQGVWCAFEAWRDAGCMVVDCGHPACATGTGAAVCATDGESMTGRCEYPPAP